MDEPIVFSQEQTEFLEKAAKRYIWWMTKEEAMMDPFFVISQVMNLGDLKDSAKLFCEFDHKILRQVLLNASQIRVSHNLREPSYASGQLHRYK